MNFEREDSSQNHLSSLIRCPGTINLFPYSHFHAIIVTKSKLALLTARQANESGDEVLRQGILYSESWLTEKMADYCLQKTILSGFECQFLL